MTSLLRRIVVGAVVLSVSACGFVPIGDAWFNFHGVVSDPSGRPVEGALVTVLVDGENIKTLGRDDTPVVSDSAGRYSFHSGACPCEFAFTLKVTKDGYKPYTLNLDANKSLRMKVLNIVLEPLGPDR